MFMEMHIMKKVHICNTIRSFIIFSNKETVDRHLERNFLSTSSLPKTPQYPPGPGQAKPRSQEIHLGPRWMGHGDLTT